MQILLSVVNRMGKIIIAKTSVVFLLSLSLISTKTTCNSLAGNDSVEPVEGDNVNAKKTQNLASL